jgi:hypothetical protein
VKESKKIELPGIISPLCPPAAVDEMQMKSTYLQ